MKIVTGLLLMLAFLGSAFAYKSYHDYQVLGTRPLSDKTELSAVWSILGDSKFLPWNRPSVGRGALIMTSPQQVTYLKQLLDTINMQPYTHIQDVHSFLEGQRKMNTEVKNREINSGRNVTFDRYMDHSEIEEYLDEVVSTFPEIASLEVIGNSYEGRPLRVLKLSTSRNSSKPGVFINAGIHAAEWLGPPTAMYAIYQLTAVNQALLDTADFYVLPVSNPDGYVFSWEQDRLWRKTRRPNPGSDCIGTDPNRNFDSHWGEGGVVDPCEWNYAGSNVFSEVESKALADYIKAKGQRGELALFMDLHTPGPYILYPYGYSTDLPPTPLITAAVDASAAVQAVRGQFYVVGSIANILYFAYGNSQDYAYDVAGVPFSYTWELMPGGDTNFDPPPEEIRPAIEEVWEGFKVLVNAATQIFNNKKH